MHARARWWPWTGWGWQQREECSPLVVHRGGHGLLRARVYREPRRRWRVSLPRIHSCMCTPGRRTSLAKRHGRKNFNRAATCVSTVKSYVRFGVKCGIGALTNVHIDVRTQIGGLRAAAGGRAAFAAGQDARDTYGSARRAAFAFQLSVGTACRRADQRVRSSAAC